MRRVFPRFPGFGVSTIGLQGETTCRCRDLECRLQACGFQGRWFGSFVPFSRKTSDSCFCVTESPVLVKRAVSLKSRPVGDVGDVGGLIHNNNKKSSNNSDIVIQPGASLRRRRPRLA